MESVMSGKVFNPSVKFRNKMWFMGIMIAVLLWAIVAFIVMFAGTAVYGSWYPGDWGEFYANAWIWVNAIYWGITAIWLIPGIIIMPYYLRSIEYSVIAHSGEAMPEIYVKKGIINITRKHVPFRTITNIMSRAGPFDRIFGIGSVEIETAGTGGQMQTGPEEKLEGLIFYEELRDFILRELRRFKGSYVTGTEVVLPEDETSAPAGESLEEEVLRVLYEIRDLLRRQRE
jgi:membrane protein YdbS with pleckstrin-like domain